MIPLASTGSTALTPQQIQSAYGINGIMFSGGKITGNGAGQTIAIVDAYNDPNITSDLAAFDAKYGLAAPPSFKVDNLGATTTDPGWSLETALDVEWAHAIAPGANIVLVEAASTSLSALLGAVSTAGALPGVSVVSMSWGTSEFYGEWNYTNAFTTASGHNNVTFVAASGDAGAWSGPEFPSVAPNVLAVGGSTLSVTSAGTYSSETGWTDSTGGFSGLDNGYRYGFSAPSYQTSTLTAAGLNYGIRTTPDVSFNANPSSGVAVYDSVAYSGQSGWFDVGGTSAAAPAWAGLIAITDQGLATAGKSSLSTTQTLTDLYSLPSSDFNDITSGFNGYSATTGYDLVTGLGTPKAQSLVAGLLAANGATSTTTSPISSPTTTTTTSGSSSGHRSDVTTTSNNGAQGGSGSASTTSSSLSGTLTTSTAAVGASSSIAIGALTTSTSQTSTSLLVAGSTSSQSAAQTAPLTGQGGSTSASLGQSLLQPVRSIVGESSDDIVASRLVDNVDSTRTPEPAPAETPKPAPAQMPAPHPLPALPVQPAGDSAKGDFDRALEQVSAGSLMGWLDMHGPRALDRDEARDTNQSLGVSALVGIAAAAAGYRFVFRQSDERKIRKWWSARFATN